MDFNIAIILYFASKGIGKLYTVDNEKYMTVESNSKIVLSGSGIIIFMLINIIFLIFKRSG